MSQTKRKTNIIQIITALATGIATGKKKYKERDCVQERPNELGVVLQENLFETGFRNTNHCAGKAESQEGQL